MNKKTVITTLLLFLGVGLALWFFLFFVGEKDMSFRQDNQGIFEKEIEMNDLEEVQEENRAIIEPEDSNSNDENEAEQEEKDSIDSQDSEGIIDTEKDVSSGNNENEPEIRNNLVSWGFSPASTREIDTIILHSSFNSLGGDQYDVEAIIDIYRQYGVSAHYIIGRDGTIYRLVREKDVSYHAGVSEVPDGRSNVNNFSIGIEIVGNYDDGFTSDQYEAVNDLVEDIKNRYDIEYVLGHDEIAPGRKTDPWNFNWNKIER